MLCSRQIRNKTDFKKIYIYINRINSSIMRCHSIIRTFMTFQSKYNFNRTKLYKNIATVDIDATEKRSHSQAKINAKIVKRID